MKGVEREGGSDEGREQQREAGREGGRAGRRERTSMLPWYQQ